LINHECKLCGELGHIQRHCRHPQIVH
jgi:hypothetical protein